MVSGILLLIALLADLSSFLAREAAQDEYSYRIAQQAAFSCARLAASRLDADPLRFVDISTTTIQLPSSSICKILSASMTGDAAGINVQGENGQSSVHIYFSASRASSTSPFKLTTWTEY